MKPLVLVLENINKCDTCPLYAPDEKKPGCGRCLKTKRRVSLKNRTEENLRPKWCPLVPLPRPWGYEPDGNNDCEPLEWINGYNACLGEITNGKVPDDWEPRTDW